MGKKRKSLLNIERKLKNKMGDRLRSNESMSRHTTIGLGGRARLLALPRSAEEIIFLLRFARGNNIDYAVIGRGSNLLVRDGGFDGLIIKLAGNFAKIRVNARSIYAEAGASLSLLARKSVSLGRTGLEFAVGIPGSVGGAVRMNAGAYGRDISSVLLRTKCINAQDQVLVVKAGDASFGYRYSALPKDTMVLSVSLECVSGTIDDFLLKKSLSRKRTQPLESRSFGSVFLNPPGDYAGRMIEECGLKMTKIGGAMFSGKHANFILNVGPSAKAEDVEALMILARKKVKKRFGINLKPEVAIIGNN